MVGKVDRLDRIPAGADGTDSYDGVIVVDYKTGKAPDLNKYSSAMNEEAAEDLLSASVLRPAARKGRTGWRLQRTLHPRAQVETSLPGGEPGRRRGSGDAVGGGAAAAQLARIDQVLEATEAKSWLHGPRSTHSCSAASPRPLSTARARSANATSSGRSSSIRFGTRERQYSVDYLTLWELSFAQNAMRCGSACRFCTTLAARVALRAKSEEQQRPRHVRKFIPGRAGSPAARVQTTRFRFVTKVGCGEIMFPQVPDRTVAVARRGQTNRCGTACCAHRRGFCCSPSMGG